MYPFINPSSVLQKISNGVNYVASENCIIYGIMGTDDSQKYTITLEGIKIMESAQYTGGYFGAPIYLLIKKGQTINIRRDNAAGDNNINISAYKLLK